MVDLRMDIVVYLEVALWVETDPFIFILAIFDGFVKDIHLEEFLSMMAVRMKANEKIKQVFDFFDTDCDG